MYVCINTREVQKVAEVQKLRLNEANPMTGKPDLNTVIMTHSPDGYAFNRPIEFRLPTRLGEAEKDIYDFIIRSLAGHSPSLIPFACESSAIFELAKYLRRSLTSSGYTLRCYVGAIARFCRWCKREPDKLIGAAKDDRGFPNLERLAEHARLLDDFVGVMQARGLAPNTVSDYVKALKTLYRANGLELRLPYRLKTTVKYEDRAPTPEELQRLIDVGNLRDKVIVSMLALGGFRIGTLAKLRYKHVKSDLEQGRVPIHVHVEAEITKGKYHSYDTFLGKEAVDYLKAYLDVRRRGTLRKIRYSGGCTTYVGLPPEEIHDESPLIRNEHDAEVKPVKPQRIDAIVRSLYQKAGLLSEGPNRRYELRAHSIRKFFRTQLAALGVQSDYINYMMGHKISTYHDIKMKGIEFLRNVYASSGLSIRPKTKATRLEMLKQIVRAWGMDPDKVLVKEAFIEPHRTIVSPLDHEEVQIRALSQALKEMILKELSNQVKSGENSCK
jgi:integrase